MSNRCFDLQLPRDSLGPVYQKAYLDQVVETRVINLDDKDSPKTKGLPAVTVVLDRDGVEDHGEDKIPTSSAGSATPDPSSPPEPPIHEQAPTSTDVDALPISDKNFIEVVLDPPTKKKTVDKKYSYNDIRTLCKENGIRASGTKKSLIKQLQKAGVKLEK
jgi:hypothetical protein